MPLVLQSGGRVFWATPLFILACWMAWTCEGNHNWHELMSAVFLSCSEDTLQFFLVSGSDMPPSFLNSPWGLGSSMILMCNVWLSTLQIFILCTLINLWVYVLNLVHYTKKHLWWGLGATLISGCRKINLEGNLRLCSFSRTVIVYSFLGPMSSQPWVFGYIYSIRYAFYFTEGAKAQLESG